MGEADFQVTNGEHSCFRECHCKRVMLLDKLVLDDFKRDALMRVQAEDITWPRHSYKIGTFVMGSTHAKRAILNDSPASQITL